MFDFTALLQALIGLATVGVTGYLIPYIHSRMGAEKLDRMRSWTEIGVKAAEQIYNGPGRGAEKKAYVLNFLRARGMKVDTEQLRAFVESAVKDMNGEMGILISEEVDQDE